MFSLSQLTSLARALRDRRVLSVYIDGSAADPAMQRTWRLHIDRAVKDLRASLAGASREEREEFENCARDLEGELALFDPGIGALGAVSFISSAGISETHTLPVQTPTMVVWSHGPCLAPYIRAVKQARAVIVAVSDARRTRIYKYRLGRLEHLENVRSHHAVPAPAHMGSIGRVGFHSGTRGSTGRDVAQRALRSGRDRMINEAVQRIGELADGDGWMVVGGIHRVASRIAERLSLTAAHRVLLVETLDVHSTEAEIAAAAAAAASTLRDASDSRRLDEIGEAAGAQGLGIIGIEEMRQALAQRCVRDILVTRRFLDSRPDEAEWVVYEALAQDALIEEVSRDVADRLDGIGGIVAGLRFRPAILEVPVGV